MTEKKTRAPGGGRKPQHPEEGPMKSLTIRLPPTIKARLDIVFRNQSEFTSRSHVVAAALEAWLPAAEKAIGKAPAAGVSNPPAAAPAAVPPAPIPPPPFATGSVTRAAPKAAE